jgi:rubrerythrin
MQLHTASETISFIREIENRIASYVEDLATRFPTHGGTLTALAGENRKYVKLLEQAYYSVITDAIEGGFAFNLDTADFDFETTESQDSELANAMEQLLELEQTAIRLYETAAAQSRSLMADVPRTMQQIVRKRQRHLDLIRSIAQTEPV